MTDTTKERAPMKNRDLIAEIARELYDRFVMGGWEPQDAYVQIDEWLGRVEQSTETPSADELIELLEDCLDCLRMEFGDCDGCTTDPCTQCRAKALIRNSSIVAEAPRPVGTPEQLLTASDVAKKLANVGGIDRWAGILQQWLDSYTDRWKKEEKIWHDGPVGTPLGRCPQCESHDRKLRNLLGRIGYFHHCENSWHDGPVGTPESAIESADELAKAAFALGKLAGERGKKP